MIKITRYYHTVIYDNMNFTDKTLVDTLNKIHMVNKNLLNIGQIYPIVFPSINSN